jgi:hypothetical protein
VVTHFHAGHLEPESLALLERSTAVAVPSDPTVRTVVEAMGFTNVTTVAAGDRISAGNTTIQFTGTGQGFPYVGVLLADTTGSCWYMGDRGDTLAPQDMLDVVNDADGVDVLVPSHPSDFHSYLMHSTWDGGANEGETHATWMARTVETVARIAPKMALPQSTSFKYVGRADWLNRFMFPMRPEEFSRIAGEMVPTVCTEYLAPGDAVVLTDRQPVIHRSSVPFVELLPGAEPRGLDTTRPAPEVADADPDGLGDAKLLGLINRYLEHDLTDWLDNHRGTYLSLLDSYRRYGHTYRLTVVLPSSETASWRIVWKDSHASVLRLAADEPLTYNEAHTRIAASVLERWLRDEIPYFVAAVDTRRTGSFVELSRTAGDRVVAVPVETRCFVSAHLMSDRARLDRWLAGEVQATLAHQSAQTKGERSNDFRVRSA